MKLDGLHLLRRPLLREIIAAWMAGTLVLQCAHAAAPAWWQQRGVFKAGSPVADDYAALNVGQLKNFTRAAIYELHSRLPGGAGNTLYNLLATWRTEVGTRDDYAVVTVGQLKAVAKPVYSAMMAAGLTPPQPWTALAEDDDDHAVANVGQAKAVFAFVLPDYAGAGLLDADGDGFSDVFEALAGTDATNPDSHPDGTGDLARGGVVNGGDGLPPYVDPYPDPWPDFTPTTPDLDSDHDGVPDREDAVWYDPDFTHQRSGKPFYSIMDLGECSGGGFATMADNGALLWWTSSTTMKLWNPQAPTQPTNVSFTNSDGPSGSEWASLYGTMSEAGLLFGLARERAGNDIQYRLFTFDPETGDSSWLPKHCPDKGVKTWVHVQQTAPVVGFNGTLHGKVDYRELTADGKTRDWTAIYMMQDGAFTFTDDRLVADYPALPEDPPVNLPSYHKEPFTQPGWRNAYMITQATNSGVAMELQQQKLRVYKQVVPSPYFDLPQTWAHWVEPVPLEDWRRWRLVTEDGTKLLLEADVQQDETYTTRSIMGGSPSPAPWLACMVTEHATKDWFSPVMKQTASIYKPSASGDYDSFPIYASHADYQAGRAIQRINWVTAKRQALVQIKDLDEDHTGWHRGLWADGEVTLMEKLVGNYSQYTTWIFQDVSGDGMIAATAVKNNQRRMLLLVPFTTHQIAEDGSISAAGGGVQASLPSPVLDMSCQVQNLRVQADGSILGDLAISGGVTSKACDNVKGALGTITEGQVWVNGAETPHSTFSIQPSKQNTGTRERPYPYSGSFNTTIANVPLTAGNNTFKFTTQDPVYDLPGYSTWAVTLQVTDPEEDDDGGGGGGGGGNPPGSFSLAVQLPAATLAAASADTVQATLVLGGTAVPALSMQETSASSGVFTATLPDGRPARLTLTGAAALTVEAVDTMNATLLLGAAGAGTSYSVGLRESAAASGLFTGGYVGSSSSVAGSSGGSTSGGGVTSSGTSQTGGSTSTTGGTSTGGAGTGSGTATAGVSVSTDPYEGMQEVEKSNGGEFHRFAISVGVPEGLKDHFKMAFDGQNVGLMKDPATGLMVLKDPGQSTPMPLTTAFRPATTSPDETDQEHAKRMEEMKDVSFEKGFACGVGYAGVDMVVGTGKMIWGGVKFVGRGFQAVGLQFQWAWNWGTGQDNTATENLLVEIGQKQTEVVEQAYEMAKFLNGLLVGPQTMLPKMVWAFMTGDEDLKATALFGSDSHRQLFQLACDALAETRKEWETGTEGQRGYLSGRVLGEVLTLIIPAGAAGKVLSKIEVIAHLKNTRLFKAASRAVMTAQQALLASTRMCFEPGTKVKTGNEELMKIEEVRPNTQVWSRDPATGQECLKRVLQTFTTHPTELYRLTYEVRGPPGSSPLPSRVESETLGVTAPHPFWVCNNEPPGFIAAEELRVGDVLFISGGREAVVTSMILEHAAPGETFTTYNFEVEGFHTYFVGDAGVWVHNSGRPDCERLAAIYNHMRQKRIAEGIVETPYSTFFYMLDTLSASTKADNVRLFNVAFDMRKGVFNGRALRFALKAMNDDMYAMVAAGQMPISSLPTMKEIGKMFRGLGVRGSPNIGDFDRHHLMEADYFKRLFAGDPDAVPAYIVEALEHRLPVGGGGGTIRADLVRGIGASTDRGDIYWGHIRVYERLGHHDLAKVFEKWWTTVMNQPIPPEPLIP